MREIAAATNVSGPPYRLTEVARERGLLDVSAGAYPRQDPPFAFRELITSQATKSSIPTRTNASWKNWVRDHFSSNLTEYRPRTPRELVEAVVENVRAEKRIRAVGSGHSHSKVAAPDENYIRLSWLDSNDKLAGLVDAKNQPWIGAPAPSGDEARVRVQAGATIKYLNRKLLLDKGYGLFNMGSFDAQTLAGAINTSTHGTGAQLGSLADTVESVELVTVMDSPAQPGTPLVRAFRIEPEHGITDRRAFENAVGTHGATLIQDDDVFHSVVVGYGCMGVAHTYTMRVTDRYYLHEDNETLQWKEFKDEIADRRAPPDHSKRLSQDAGARHFQFRINLAQLDTRNDPGSDPSDWNPRGLLVSHREPHEYDSSIDRWPDKPHGWNENKTKFPPEREFRGTQYFFRKRLNGIKGKGLPPKRILDFVPVGINSNFASAQNKPPFQTDVGSFSTPSDPTGNTAPSHVALRRKFASLAHDPHAEPEPPPPAISTEIAVPADQVVTAVEAVFDEVVDNEYAFSAPMGVRFTARGEHALSPEYRGDNDRDVPVAKVEVPFLVGAYKVGAFQPFGSIITQQQMIQHGKNALADIEQRLFDLVDDGTLDFARPHMGKTNTVGEDPNRSSRHRLTDIYEKFDTWQAVHEEFNAYGTFNNGFTRDKGLSQ